MSESRTMKMRVNIENTVRFAGDLIRGEQADYYRFSLAELIKHLKMVREKHLVGRSAEILDEFFDLYVFNDDQQKGDER